MSLFRRPHLSHRFELVDSGGVAFRGPPDLCCRRKTSHMACRNPSQQAPSLVDRCVFRQILLPLSHTQKQRQKPKQWTQLWFLFPIVFFRLLSSSPMLLFAWKCVNGAAQKKQSATDTRTRSRKPFPPFFFISARRIFTSLHSFSHSRSCPRSSIRLKKAHQICTHPSFPPLILLLHSFVFEILLYYHTSIHLPAIPLTLLQSKLCVFGGPIQTSTCTHTILCLSRFFDINPFPHSRRLSFDVFSIHNSLPRSLASLPLSKS